MGKVISKVISDPVGSAKRAIYKSTIGRLKYGRSGGYDASRYWADRLSKYGLAFKGVGDEGLSEEENRQMYAAAEQVLKNVLREEKIDLTDARVLEIGCGSGYWTGIFRDLGVRSYRGIDITDVLFSHLMHQFPEYVFARKDITSDEIGGVYDLIVMIDVIEHITEDVRLAAAMDNVKTCLAESGIFLVAPVMKNSKKHLFYVRAWSFADIQPRFAGYEFGTPVPFRTGSLLTVRKP